MEKIKSFAMLAVKTAGALILVNIIADFLGVRAWIYDPVGQYKASQVKAS